MAWSINRLTDTHLLDGFRCGKWDIDRFLTKRARHNSANDLGRTFVATLPDDPTVLGFYTLANGTVTAERINDDLALSGFRHPLGTIHIGKLAVAQQVQRQGLGSVLLVDAICRAVRLANESAAYAIDLHVVDDDSARFYSQFGFRALPDTPRHLYLPMQKARTVASIASSNDA